MHQHKQNPLWWKEAHRWHMMQESCGVDPFSSSDLHTQHIEAELSSVLLLGPPLVLGLQRGHIHDCTDEGLCTICIFFIMHLS